MATNPKQIYHTFSLFNVNVLGSFTSVDSSSSTHIVLSVFEIVMILPSAKIERQKKYVEMGC